MMRPESEVENNIRWGWRVAEPLAHPADPKSSLKAVCGHFFGPGELGAKPAHVVRTNRLSDTNEAWETCKAPEFRAQFRYILNQ
jgi:hypothetical protein